MSRALFFLCLALMPISAFSEGFTIGVILPLSGAEASMGESVRNGIELGYEALPPQERGAVKLLFEDDQMISAQTVSAYQKLRNTSKLNALFVLGSTSGNAVGPIAEKDRMPTVAIGASDPNVVKEKRYIFLHWVTPEAEAKLLAEEMIRRGYQRLGFVTHEQEGAVAISTKTLRALTDKGVQTRVVLDEHLLRSTSDYKPVVTKLKAKQVDGVFLMLMPEGIVGMAKEIRAAGIKADLIGAETFEDDALVKAANGILNGQWYVNVASATPEFEAAYRKRFGKNPSWAAANGYDSLVLMVKALRSGSGNPEKTVEYLEKLQDYSGAAGKYSSSPDHRFTLPAVVKVVTEKGFQELPPSVR